MQIPNFDNHSLFNRRDIGFVPCDFYPLIGDVVAWGVCGKKKFFFLFLGLVSAVP